MSTVARQAFSSSQNVTVSRGSFAVTQTNVNAAGENYTGKTWGVYSSQQYRANLSNTSTSAGNQDKSLEIKLTGIGFEEMLRAQTTSWAIGDYTNASGGFISANKQRINLSGTFTSSTSGFGSNTDYITQVGSDKSYHYFNGTTYAYSPPFTGNNLSVGNLNFEYNPSTGADTFDATNFDFRVKHTVEENTSNNSFIAYTYITPRIIGTLTNYWLANSYIFDGIDGDTIDIATSESTVVCTASVKVGIADSYAFTTPSTFTSESRNFVAFPEEGVPLIYIEDDYVATEGDYIVTDYVAQDYFETGAVYFEDAPAFNVSGLMTQSFAGDFTMPPTLLGQLISIGGSLVADTQATTTPTLNRPASAFISASSTADFSAGRIRPGTSTIESATEVVFSSGRLQQIASDLVADTQMAPTYPFLLQGGEGIVAGASQVFTEGGYLQTLGSVNFNGASQVVTGSQANANLGIILKGFEVDAEATSSVTSLGGMALPGISNLLSEFTTEVVPGYLWSGQGSFTSTSAITSTTSLLFAQPSSFMTMESTIAQPFLAGFRLLGEADLLSNGGTLAAGKLWIIDDYRRLTVKQQTRAFAIVAELRKINTVQETRLNTVEQELSLAKVKQETRQFKLPIAPIVFVSPTRTERI